jgi:hypothetical protein
MLYFENHIQVKIEFVQHSQSVLNCQCTYQPSIHFDSVKKGNNLNSFTPFAGLIQPTVALSLFAFPTARESASPELEPAGDLI